jgi:hypothetical protein
MKITINKPEIKTIPMLDLPAGRFAEVMESYTGTIVFRDYEGRFVSIGPSANIDGFSRDCPLKVRVLEPGESFTVNV